VTRPFIQTDTRGQYSQHFVNHFLDLAGDKCIYHEVHIEDFTDYQSASSDREKSFPNVFPKRSEVTPIIIKYRHGRNGDKALAIILPENLPVFSFLREYGKKITLIHDDFYKAPSQMGRTKETTIDRKKCARICMMKKNDLEGNRPKGIPEG
jgi:hypothetical protein